MPGIRNVCVVGGLEDGADGVGAAAIRAEAIDGGDNGWVKRDGFGSPYHLNGFVTI